MQRRLARKALPTPTRRVLGPPQKPMSHMPMFGFFLLAFLALLLILAIAAFLVFKSGEPGTSKLSGPAGCAIGCALIVLAGMGAIGTGCVALLALPDEVVRHGPIESFEFHWDDQPLEKDDQLALKLTLRGNIDPARVSRWVRENVHGNATIQIETRGEGDERRVEVLVRMPLSRHEREELERARRDLERELPTLDVPDSVKIELRGPND
jgi:hypothetical protein